ncbi:MAG: hypothetical protein QM723_04070 [Myxococcaceae bacterium]
MKASIWPVMILDLVAERLRLDDVLAAHRVQELRRRHRGPGLERDQLVLHLVELVLRHHAVRERRVVHVVVAQVPAGEHQLVERSDLDRQEVRLRQHAVLGREALLHQRHARHDGGGNCTVGANDQNTEGLVHCVKPHVAVETAASMNF